MWLKFGHVPLKIWGNLQVWEACRAMSIALRLRPDYDSALAVTPKIDLFPKIDFELSTHIAHVVATGVPRSYETPAPIGSAQVSRHRATVGSYGGGFS